MTEQAQQVGAGAGRQAVGKLARHQGAVKAHQSCLLHKGVQQQRHIAIAEKNLRPLGQHPKIKPGQQTSASIAGPGAEDRLYRGVMEHGRQLVGALRIGAGQKAVAGQDMLAEPDDKAQFLYGPAAAAQPFRVHTGGRRDDPDAITGPQPGRCVEGLHDGHV